MRSGTITALAAALIATAPVGAQDRPAKQQGIDNFADQRLTQKIGRVVVDPAGRFVIYEWQRAFDWTPSAKGLPRPVAERPQVTLYRVAIPDYTPVFSGSVLTSYELFPPNPGASYYLGNLSPDAAAIGFYEIDRDTNALRAGSVRTSGESIPEISWFDQAPDAERLSQAAVSLDGQTWVYPVRGGWARADVKTGRSERCSSCYQRATDLPTPGATNEPVKNLPEGAKPVGASRDGSLVVYALDTAEKLGLYYARNGRLAIVFENRR